jgi:hypothetical protein
LVRDYRIGKAIKSPDILKKESAKVKGCYSKAVRRVIAFFKQSVYYNYNRVKFEEFEHVRKRPTKSTNMSF